MEQQFVQDRVAESPDSIRFVSCPGVLGSRPNAGPVNPVRGPETLSSIPECFSVVSRPSFVGGGLARDLPVLVLSVAFFWTVHNIDVRLTQGETSGRTVTSSFMIEGDAGEGLRHARVEEITARFRRPDFRPF